MKTGGRIVLYSFGVLVLLAVAAIAFTIGWRPIVGPRIRPLTDRKFEATQRRMERGRYLVTGVAGCLGCHTEPDLNLPGAPAKAGREGAGFLLLKNQDVGTLYASNITPDPETGIGRWSDDQLARAIREGIGGDNRALFPIMPYQNFSHLPDEDLASIVVYIRSIPAIRNPVPKTQITFPLNRFIMAVPQPITEPVREPDLSTPQKRGEHLTRLSSCADCHTPQDRQGQPMQNLAFAGGFVLDSPSGKKVAALNITPDPSGIPYYDETVFLNTIRTGQIGARKLDPDMPWVFYRNMTDSDLKDVFSYLKTLKPVTHYVDNEAPPTPCPLCGYTHGLGNKNKK